jgi:hypothetical protein
MNADDNLGLGIEAQELMKACFVKTLFTAGGLLEGRCMIVKLNTESSNEVTNYGSSVITKDFN